jgi:Tol biopolymer transport system component
LIANDDAGTEDPGWSSDGQKVVFTRRSPGSPKTEDLRILDLVSHQVVPVPGSTGLFSPRWSPDDRHIAALARVAPYLRVFDVTSQRWAVLPTTRAVGFPCFSRDSQTIYFITGGPDRGIFRIRVTAGKEERVADMKEWHLAGLADDSLALDATVAPLVMRDVGSDDIYALRLEEK